MKSTIKNFFSRKLKFAGWACMLPCLLHWARSRGCEGFGTETVTTIKAPLKPKKDKEGLRFSLPLPFNKTPTPKEDEISVSFHMK